MQATVRRGWQGRGPRPQGKADRGADARSCGRDDTVEAYIEGSDSAVTRDDGIVWSGDVAILAHSMLILRASRERCRSASAAPGSARRRAALARVSSHADIRSYISSRLIWAWLTSSSAPASSKGSRAGAAVQQRAPCAAPTAPAGALRLEAGLVVGLDLLHRNGCGLDPVFEPREELALAHLVAAPDGDLRQKAGHRTADQHCPARLDDAVKLLRGVGGFGCAGGYAEGGADYLSPPRQPPEMPRVIGRARMPPQCHSELCR